MGRYEDLRGTADSLLAVTGRAQVFGDRVSQQQLLADNQLSQPADSAKNAILATIDANFGNRLSDGDIMVGGLSFGFDAAHPAIVIGLKGLGIAAVVARSFGAAFLRNAIDCGLAALVVEETGAIKRGDRLRVDIEAHVIANQSSGDRYVIRNIDDDDLATLRAGGLAARAAAGRQG